MSSSTGPVGAASGDADAFAGTTTVAPSPGASLPRGEIGLLGVLMPGLAQAVIDGNPDQAAALAAEHFSLTESMLRELHARVMLRAGTTSQESQEPQEPQE